VRVGAGGLGQQPLAGPLIVTADGADDKRFEPADGGDSASRAGATGIGGPSALASRGRSTDYSAGPRGYDLYVWENPPARPESGMSAAAPPATIGRYEVVSKIAEGGMGAVFKARHPDTGELVAIKVVPAETAKNPLLIKRFEQEFRAASLIDHPNVVKALEYGGGATPYLVMEFVDGESLGQRVDRDGPLPEAEAVRLMGMVCEGLHRAHKQGLIHRDVKPDNILVTRDGVAKLTDLGLVKDMEAEMNLTRTGRGLGTPHYMAPEQFRNAKNADVRCDVYSLGATLYTLLTGEVPFAKTSPLDCWMKKTKNDFPPPRDLNPRLTERVNWAIRRAMHADAGKRPASVREFMEDLTGIGWRSGAASGSFTAPLPDDLPPPPKSEPIDLWYMVYAGPDGQPRTVKGTTDSIRRNAASGSVGEVAAILVSRTKHGGFRPLREVAEFRDLSADRPPTEPTPVVPPPSGRYVVAPEAAATLSGRFAIPPAAETAISYRVTPAADDEASAERTVRIAVGGVSMRVLVAVAAGAAAVGAAVAVAAVKLLG
jgi:serine/threonine protein kinase